MTKIHTLNAGMLQPEDGPEGPSGCRCLLLETEDGFALVDTGFGRRELEAPQKFFGNGAEAFWHIVADPDLSAIAQVERMGLRRRDIRHIVCTHLDMDHAGGLADFPEAAVHVCAKEYDSVARRNPRYLSYQFEHGPRWVVSGGTMDPIAPGLEGWPLSFAKADEFRLATLFGHTAGHCGVVIQCEAGTVIHCGDAYYRKMELEAGHPADSMFPVKTALDNDGRLRSLDILAALTVEMPHAVLVSTHDRQERTPFPAAENIGEACYGAAL